jgi:hypothetical protein
MACISASMSGHKWCWNDSACWARAVSIQSVTNQSSSLSGRTQIGGDHLVLVGDQPADGLRADQPEAACDKNFLGHLPPAWASPGACPSTGGYDILLKREYHIRW